VGNEGKSGCPINLTLEVLGDRWSLLVIRDIIFGNRRHFRELLLNSEEGIASNILADRLKTLLKEGIITKAADPSHAQKAIYSLTEQGIELLPVLAQMAAWGQKYLPTSEELAIRAQLLQAGGAGMCQQFMAELRAMHLGPGQGTSPKSKATPSVSETLQKGYEEVVARRARMKQKPRRGGAPKRTAR
jgi:DNA-binding HxlR family transcriptional regulator